jgi:CheY-like chemotaxis protein
MAPKVVDLNKSLGDMQNMLRRIIGEDIRLSTKLFSAPCLAKVDPGLMEQIVMNLVLNARDAVSKDGEITLETSILSPSPAFSSAHPDLAPGQLVCVKVRDNGCGMGPEERKHLFEPFYTTKEKYKGTGLGLSMVFGTVKQSGGEIVVESEPGVGSSFGIYFPLVEAVIPEKAASATVGVSKGGTETVLLVEDEEPLRRLGERLLRAQGYTVITAADGGEALAAAGRYGKPVDLLLTDLVMPGMSGRELALELERRKLALRTLYMSGYTDEAIVKHGVLEPGIAFIYKPFTADALYGKLREVLDGPADQAKA